MTVSPQQLAPRPLRHTLKLALAMRGGVSLAVWIGGAVAEIDVLRRTKPADLDAEGEVAPTPEPEEDHTQPERMKIYAHLLHLAAYDGVQVDILAGASAGGLNAVLYGAAQSLGRTIDHLDKTWAQLGGMWGLMREPTQISRASSVLQGDQYFYVRVHEQLTALADGEVGRPAPPGGDLTIDLAATLLADADGGRPLGNRAQFHFVGRDAALGSEFNDLPRGADGGVEEVEQALKRLALAARSTSSFPGAFEPSAIYSTAQQREGERPGGDALVGLGETRLPVMWGSFSAARAQGDETSGPFYVVDGGVFDNIPVDRALRAIELAPAEHQTSRRLLYLDPDPPASPTRRPGLAKGTEWLTVILGAKRLQKRAESAGEELQLVRERNDRVREMQTRCDELATLLETEAAAASLVADTAGYARFRADRDTAAFGRLLTDPTRVLVGRMVTGDTRPPLTSEQALHIAGHVRGLYADEAVSLTLTRDVPALIDTATLLISWIRGLQQASEREVLGNEKRVLYRLLFAANLLRQHADAAILAHPWSQESSGRDDMRTALVASRSYLDLTCDPARIRQTFSPGIDHSRFYELIEELREGTGSPLMDALWQVADDAWRSIRMVKVTRPIQPRSPVQELPRIYPVLADLPPASFPIESLHRLFVPAGGVPGTAAEVGYHEITGGQSSPIEDRFERLRKLEARAQLTALLKGKDLPEDAGLFTSHSKLAGNTLANFGGFLSQEWRLNDWRWGRLDAAAALVDVVTVNAPDDWFIRRADDASLWDTYGVSRTSDPGRDRKALTERLQRRLQELLLESYDAPDATAEDYAQSLSAGGQTLADLRPSYLFGLASRGVHLVHRSLWPSRFSVASVGTAMGLTLLRPLAVLTPLLVQPVRAAAVLMLTLLAASALTPATAGLGPTVFAALVAGGLGLYLLASALRLGSVWTSMDGGATPEHRELVDIDDGKTTFQRRRGRVWVLGVVLLAAAVVVLVMDRLDGDVFGLDPSTDSSLNGPGAVALVAALLGITVATKRATVVVFSDPHTMSRGEVVGWVVAAVAGGLAIALGYVDTTRGNTEHLLADWLPAWPAVALGMLVAVHTSVVLTGWAAQRPMCWWAGVVGVLAGLVVSARVEAWQWWGIAVLLVLAGVTVLFSAVKWRDMYRRNHLLVGGGGAGLVLLVLGAALLGTDLRSDTVSSGPLAWAFIVAGLAIAAVGRLGGDKLDIQSFAVSTGVLMSLAGVWLLLSRPSSGAVDAGLLWWAYGAWFVVMSMVTLYIRIADEPDTERQVTSR